MAQSTERHVDDRVFDFDRVSSGALHMPPMNVPMFEPPRLTPFDTGLEKATVGLLVTSGAFTASAIASRRRVMIGAGSALCANSPAQM